MYGIPEYTLASKCVRLKPSHALFFLPRIPYLTYTSHIYTHTGWIVGVSSHHEREDMCMLHVVSRTHSRKEFMLILSSLPADAAKKMYWPATLPQ